MGVLEAIPSRDFASALIGCGERLVPTEAELGKFGNLARRISFPAKTTIFTEGEPAIAIYVLTRGIARLYKTLADGRRQIVGFALPDDFLGSPLSDRYSCSVDSIGEVAVSQFLREPFLTFLQANQKSQYLMLEAALREVAASRDHMLLLGRGTAEQKFTEFIISWRARVGRKDALANLVPLPMGRRDVADYLGLTIETISRVLKKLERENLIRVIPEGLQLMGSTEWPLLFERSNKVA